MKIAWNQVTWYSKTLAFVLFIAFPIFGFCLGVQYGMLRQYVSDSAAELQIASSTQGTESLNPYYSDVSEWQTDSNNAGWSIAYPIDFNATDNYGATPSANWREGTPGGLGLQLFTLTIPKAFEPHTNLADATLTVGMSTDSGAVADCLSVGQDGPPTATSSATVNGISFTVFNFGSAAAGSFYQTTSYRTIHNGACYAIEYTIHSSDIGNYPPQYGLEPFNEAQLDDLLNRIVGTFQFSDQN